MPTYAPSTVKRAQTILRNAQRQHTAATVAKRQQARTVAPKGDWKLRPASAAQLRRINALESLLGYKPSTKRHIGNAGQASALYQALKAEAR